MCPTSCARRSTASSASEILGHELSADLAPHAHEMLDHVRHQAARLLTLVESLLSLGRLNAGAEGIVCSRFTLSGLVEELRAEAEALNADRGLALEWKMPMAPNEVEHDRTKLHAIAYHLVSNAIKFTHRGRVEVALERTPAGGVVLTVRDTGIGVPPEAREVIFEDFRQLDGSSTRRYEGLGLGLGLVKRYTALLRGSVQLESRPGEGTLITVELPAPPVAAVAPTEGAEARA